MLFKDAEDFATAFPALGAIDWEKIEPQIQLTELELFRAEVLGPTLFDALQLAYSTAITNNTQPEPKWAEILPHTRRAIAHFAYYDTLDLVSIVVGSGGAYITTSQDQERAPMWMVENFKTAALQKAHGFLNLLLSLLMSKETTDYTEWNGSPYRQEVRGSLIPRLQDANRHMRINAWLLHKLQPAIKRIQLGPVKKLLGTAAYEALVSAVHAGSTSTQQKEQMELIRPLLLHGALASMVVELGIGIDRKGVWTWESTSSGSQISGGQNSAALDRRLGLQQSQKEKAESYVSELDLLLNPERPIGREGRDYGGFFYI